MRRIRMTLIGQPVLPQGYIIVPYSSLPLEGGGLGRGWINGKHFQHPPLNPLPSREGIDF